MFHILVITQDNGFQESIKVLLPENEFRLQVQPSPENAFPFLKTGLARICILDTNLKDISAIRTVREIRRRAPEVAILVCAEEKDPQWEEDAYLNGVDFVFQKPVRGPVFTRMVQKHLPAGEKRTGRNQRPGSGFPPAPQSPLLAKHALSGSALEIMRDFSRILSYSLDLKSFVHQFILKLREVISVNRIAILLRKPGIPLPGLSATWNEDTTLDCICSIGIEADLFQYFQINLSNGIGGMVAQSGRILKADYENDLFSEENSEINHEFELLGCEVAIPIVDRERCLGIALIGGRLTGSQFADDELQLLFHLMEELGLAIRNNWLHEELSSNHSLISDVIAQFKSGCLVISPDLHVLHANPAMLDFMQKKDGPAPAFSDLPSKIACKVYEVVQKGKDIAPFMFDEFPNDERIFRISIFPIHPRKSESGAATMVLMEDFTQVEKAKQVEMEAQNAQTVALIAKRFAHEIRNALVPLSTHQQLLDTDFDKETFRNSLGKTMDRQIRRISRFADQMLLLSQSRNGTEHSTSVKSLIKDAFLEAQNFSARTGTLKWVEPFEDARIRGDLSTLKYAYMEILLNALQSVGEEAEVNVRSRIEPRENGKKVVVVDLIDRGGGFTKNAAEEALKPFFTTRNVGVGLGLTVAEKVFRAHDGSLEILHQDERNNGVRTILNLEEPNPL